MGDVAQASVDYAATWTVMGHLLILLWQRSSRPICHGELS